MSRYDVERATALKSETRVKADWNLNEAVGVISRPGETIYYQAPTDRASHPQYVDAEGRILPVNPQTLQIMTNSNGHVVDVNGNLVPGYEFKGVSSQVHEDDVRVAVVARDVVTTDENDEEVYVTPDGDLIPTGDDGLPNVVMVGGVPWVTDHLGNAVAPLSSVIPLASYRKPVEAANVPLSKSMAYVDPGRQLYDEFFPIESIVEGDRPRKRGNLVAWAENDTSGISSYTGTGEYQQGRFYTASADAKYKYWTPDEPASLNGILGAKLPVAFDASWESDHVRDVVTGGGQWSGDFYHPFSNLPPLSGEAHVYLPMQLYKKNIPITAGTSYTMTFDVVSQEDSRWRVYIGKKVFTRYGSMVKRKNIGTFDANANTPTTYTINFVSDNDITEHDLIFEMFRSVGVEPPRVSFSNLSIRPTTFPIAKAGPRVLYDRPLPTNKIVIGVDFSVDERNADSSSNMPADSVVRIMTDRGDGVFTWKTIATDPSPNNDGFIELYYNGSTWTNSEPEVEADPINVMGIHFNVWAMNMPGARLNIMEISGHLIRDFSDRFIEYNTDFEVSDSSFVLPFGTVSSNMGTLNLSNHDGLFSKGNRFLLDTERVQNGDFVFSDEPNPLFGILNGSCYWTVDTSVQSVENSSPFKEWIRMFTMKGTAPEINDEMRATIPLKDSSRILQQRKPSPLFFTDSTGMSAIQAIYMLLDSVGFTSLDIRPNDVSNAVHLNYFWSNPDATVWEMLEDLCRSTQITAFFDESDNLRLKSLHGLYQEALSTPPKSILTTDDVGNIKANIIDISDGEMSQTNRVELEYRELKPAEISESGVAKMETVWEPEGDVVLRAQPLIETLPKRAAPHYIKMPSGSTETWPWEGMVNIEGELIKYKGKVYEYHDAAGKKKFHIAYSHEDKKAKDLINPELAHKNRYDGRVRVIERGAEDTGNRLHGLGTDHNYIRRYISPNGRTTTYNPGMSFKQSKAVLTPPKNANPKTWLVMARGSLNDMPPIFYGTSLKITGGSNTAGIAVGLSPDMDGVYFELSTTEQVEALNRTRNELTIYVKRGQKRDYLGSPLGTITPISKDKFYDLHVTMEEYPKVKVEYVLKMYENITVRQGSRGAAVKALQRALNSLWKQGVVTDGVFGVKTTAAVKRVQKANNINPDGIVNKNDWIAIGSNTYNPHAVTFHVHLNGQAAHSITVEKDKLPPSWVGGQYGIFTRASTRAEFEYLYAFRGSEQMINDGDNGLLSKVTGSYFSDQINNGWFFQRKKRYVTRGGKKYLKDAIFSQFFFDDFGAWVHEVRDWDVKFSDPDNPAVYSNLYTSNTEASLVAEYQHNPLGAKFRIANTARHDAIIQGTDPILFGPDNAVDQRMMVYGRLLEKSEGRLLSVEDKNSTRSLGVQELTVNADWIQTSAAANKLGSHIVEAMSMPVKTFEVKLFGNPYLKVGDMVVVHAPAQGASAERDESNINSANRYVVVSVSHDNDGSHATSATVRQLIDKSGFRYVRLSDVLERNNNNMLRNQYLDEYEMHAAPGFFTRLVPKDVEWMADTSVYYRSQGSGKGYMELRGTTSTPSATYRGVGFTPKNILLKSGSRPAHTIGEYYLWTTEVTALTDCTVRLALDGYHTSGFSRVLDYAVVRLKKGKTQRITLKGQYLDNGHVPEVSPRLYLLNYDAETPGSSKERIYVHDMFYRSSNSEAHIYPDSGYFTLRRP